MANVTLNDQTMFNSGVLTLRTTVINQGTNQIEYQYNDVSNASGFDIRSSNYIDGYNADLAAAYGYFYEGPRTLAISYYGTVYVTKHDGSSFTPVSIDLDSLTSAIETVEFVGHNSAGQQTGLKSVTLNQTQGMQTVTFDASFANTTRLEIFTAAGITGRFYFDNLVLNPISGTTNQAPVVVTDRTLTVANGSTTLVSTSYLAASDADNTDAQLTYTLTAGPFYGNFTKNGATVSTWTQADLDNGLIFYRQNGASTDYDSCNFAVTDPSGAYAYGVFNVTVTGDVSPPTLITNNTLTDSVGGSATITSSVLFANDNSVLGDQVTFTVVTAPSYGSILRNGVAVTSFTQADISAGLITYRENGTVTTADSFVFNVKDSSNNRTGNYTFRVSIGDTTIPVVATNNTLSTTIGSTSTIGATLLTTNDAGNTHAQLTYTITAAPSYGTLLRNGVAVSSFTQADIDSGIISYREISNGASSDSFTFYVSDPSSNRSTSTTFRISIGGDTVAPTAITNTGVFTTVGGTTAITSSVLQYNDNYSSHAQLTYSIVAGPSHGTLLRNGFSTTSFTQADIDNGLITYRQDGSTSSSDLFSYYVTDAANNRTATVNESISISASTGLVIHLDDLEMWNSGAFLPTGSSQYNGGYFYYYSNVSNYQNYDIVNRSVTSSFFVGFDSSYASQVNYFYDGARVLVDVYGGNGAGGVVRTSHHDGSYFGAISINLDTLSAQTGVSVVFTGTKADNTTVSQTFTLDAIQGMQTFTFNTSFTNLKYLDFTPSAYVQFDGYVLTTVDSTPPTLVHNGTLSVSVGGTTVITSSLLSYSDNVSASSALYYNIVSAPLTGTLLRNGVATTTFTQADLDGGLITYMQNGSNVTADFFTFYVSDAAGNHSTTATFQAQISGSSHLVRLNDNTMYTGGFLTQVYSVGSGSGFLFDYGAVQNYSGYDLLNVSTSSSAAFVSYDQAYASQAGWFYDGAHVLVDSAGTFTTGVSTMRVARHSGGVFSATTVDLDTLYAETGVTVTFTGTKVDGSTVAQTFSLDAALGMQSFTFDSRFVGLKKLDFTGSDTFLFDNIVVDAATTIIRNDFNGDGRSDILWRSTSSTGAIYDWSMNGAAISANNYVSSLAPASWTALSTGDFSGDGKADILWRDTAGNMYDWTMNGAAIAANNYVGTLNPAVWSLAGSGDFNGDGKTDLLWRDTSGNMYDWTMNGPSIAASNYVGALSPSSWTLLSTGDFNGDGKADILWRDNSGNMYDWTMDGPTITANTYVGTLNPAVWSLAGTGDFNGDGKSDLLWRDTSGNMYDWTMNGATIAASTYVSALAPSQWTLASTGDFNGDGKTDLLWQSTSSGALYDWTMNGPAIAASDYVTTLTGYDQLAKG